MLKLTFDDIQMQLVLPLIRVADTAIFVKGKEAVCVIPILLVEDEELEMKNLQNAMNYEELGLSIIGMAFNGEDALRIIEEKHPQIVITDVVMPKVSGIEIARRLKNSGSDTKVIILTGHQRFDYAKLSLECGVVDYLIKPVLPELLRSLLERVARECAENNRKTYEERFFKAQLERNMPMLMEYFVDDLINGITANDEELHEKMDFYKINLRPDNIIAFNIMPGIDDDKKEYSKKLSHLSVRHSVEKYLLDNGYTVCCAFVNEKLVTLTNLPDKTELDSICVLADYLRCNILADCGLSATIGVGTVINGYEKIPISVSCAAHALEYRFFIGNGQVIAFDDISECNVQPSLKIKRFLPHIMEAINSGDPENVKQTLRELADVIKKAQASSDYLRVFFIELLSSVLASQYESGEVHDFDNDSEYYLNILSTDTFEGLISRIQVILLSLCEKKLNRVNSREEYFVVKIKEIIDRRYAENISIEDISAQIYISVGYAARLFRKVTGKSINSYLTEVRMCNAAKMLKNPATTIGDVADHVGYTNIAYFSSVFRKFYNCTPREFRDSHSLTV